MARDDGRERPYSKQGRNTEDEASSPAATCS